MLRRLTRFVTHTTPFQQPAQLAASRAAGAATAVSCGATRGVYSIWGSLPHEGTLEGVAKPNDQTPTLQRALGNAPGTRFHRLMTVPAADATELPPDVRLTEPEEFLLSGIEDDLKRINAVDWTVDFDSFWADRVYSHEELFDSLYSPDTAGGASWSKLIFSDCSSNEKAKLYVGARLALLQSTLKWALETERYYSAIANVRFDMQRNVFDALEREKILAGAVVLVNEFKARVPADFSRKATTDLDYHLQNLRHWVWDAPNAKMYFPRDI